MSDNVRVHLFRYTHSDGNTKDWCYPVYDTAFGESRDLMGLDVYFGTSGSKLRHGFTPIAGCKNGSPQEEAKKRSEEKCRKGYIYKGVYLMPADRECLMLYESHLSPAPKPRTTVHSWSWLVLDVNQPAFIDACKKAADKLEEVGWKLPKPNAGESIWHTVMYTSEYVADIPLDFGSKGGADQGTVAVIPRNRNKLAFLLFVFRCRVGFDLLGPDGQSDAKWPEESIPVDPSILTKLGFRSLDQLLASIPDTVENWYF